MSRGTGREQYPSRHCEIPEGKYYTPREEKQFTVLRYFMRRFTVFLLVRRSQGVSVEKLLDFATHSRDGDIGLPPRLLDGILAFGDFSSSVPVIKTTRSLPRTDCTRTACIGWRDIIGLGIRVTKRGR